MYVALEWCGENTVSGPSLIHSSVDGVPLDFEFLSPFAHNKTFPVKCKPSIGPTISHLLFRGGPPAVFRFVVSAVVYSFDRVRQTRSLPHICKEIHKGTFPSFAHLNTSPFIVRKFIRRVTAASRFHSVPRFIGGGVCHGMSCHLSTVIRGPFRTIASTRSGMIAGKIGREHDDVISAIALAVVSAGAFWCRFINNKKPSKPLSFEVYFYHLVGNLNIIDTPSQTD